MINTSVPSSGRFQGRRVVLGGMAVVAGALVHPVAALAQSAPTPPRAHDAAPVTCFACVPPGTLLYAANENSDTIVPFRVDVETGRLGRAGASIQTGSPVCIVFSTIKAGE